MKRPSTIRLVLMGGGAVLAIGTGASFLLGDSAECRQARALNLPDADAACRSDGGSSSGGHGSFVGGGSDSSGSSSSTASRGGFGGSAHSASSSS